jgi:hypothetical protein
MKEYLSLVVPALEHELMQLKVGPVDEPGAEPANEPELPTCSFRLNVERSRGLDYRIQEIPPTTRAIKRTSHNIRNRIRSLEVEALRPRSHEERTYHVWFKCQ